MISVKHVKCIIHIFFRNKLSPYNIMIVISLTTVK